MEAAEKLAKEFHNLFIKANVSFNYSKNVFDFHNQYISLHGISAVKWQVSEPRSLVGQHTTVTVDIPGESGLQFHTNAVFTCEITKSGQLLGIRFLLEPAIKNLLSDAIQNYGSLPSRFIRKYPRIPSTQEIPTMPQLAIMKHQERLIACEISNISPTGILLSTENPHAKNLIPGEVVTVQLEPRGDFFSSIIGEASVCRLIEDFNVETKNNVRCLGLKFNYFEPGHKDNFLELLQDILLRLKVKASREDD